MRAVEALYASCIEECASLYGFSAEEALSRLSLNSVRKVSKVRVVKDKNKKTSVPLPFNAEYVCKDGCNGLKHNHGLFTQCQSAPLSGSAFCKVCQSQCEKNANGKPDLGTIVDRIEGGSEFKDPKGRAPVAYLKVMNKLKLTEEMVAEAAGSQLVEPIHFVVATASAKDAEGKRGRPKNQKKIVQEEGIVEDMFANLVQNQEPAEIVAVVPAQKKVRAKVAKTIPSEPSDEEKAVKLAEKAEKDAIKAAAKEAAKESAKTEKEAAKLAEKAEKEAAKLAEKAEKEAAKESAKAEKEAAKLAKESAKAEKEAAKLAKAEKPAKKATTKKVAEPVVAVTVVPEPELESEAESEDEEEEEESAPVGVKPFEHKGVKYLRASTGAIFDPESHEQIGNWNEQTKDVDFLEEEEEEEEDEEEEK